MQIQTQVQVQAQAQTQAQAVDCGLKTADFTQWPSGLRLCILALLIAMGFLQCTSGTGEQDEHQLDEMTLTGKKVLFVHGGWDGHHPVECRDLYVPWLKSIGAEVIVSDSLGVYADSILMSQVDLIIQIWTMGEINKPQLNGLLEAVRSGTGMAGWHGGIVDAFRDQLSYHMVTGAQFLEHPGGIIPYAVNITDHQDGITQGVDDFDVNTEQYYMLVDPNVHVLATTTFSGAHMPWLEGRKMPAMWKHQYGKGRVFVTTLGHKMVDHAIPAFETTFKRGVVWACR